MTTSKSNTSWNHQQPYTKKMIHLLAKYLYRDFQFQILTILLQVQQTVQCNLSNLQVDVFLL